MKISTYIRSLPHGEKANFARRVGISPAFLYQIEIGKKQLPVQKCAMFECESKGAVTRKEIRPDDWQKIWPELIEHHEAAA